MSNNLEKGKEFRVVGGKAKGLCYVGGDGVVRRCGPVLMVFEDDNIQ